MKHTKILDLNQFALGLDIEDFTSSFTAVVSPPALFNGKHVYQILKYESNGHYYKYEGDHFSFYDPTQPTKKSSFFVGFKPVILLENEIAILSTIKFSNEYISLKCISFSLERLELKEKMYGVIKVNDFEYPGSNNFGKTDPIFNVNAINKEEIFKIFNELSKMNILEIQEKFRFIKEINC